MIFQQKNNNYKFFQECPFLTENKIQSLTNITSSKLPER